MRALTIVIAIALAALIGALPERAAGQDEGALLPPPAEPLESYTPWKAGTVDVFRRIPVMETGRIKPMDTFAQFLMLRFHGKRTLRFEAGDEKFSIGPTEWLMDVLFRPEVARTQRVFTVDDSRVIVALGLEPRAKKRDRYSYEDLRAGRRKLSELGVEYAKIKEDDRTLEQTMLVNLARNVSDFEFLNNQFAFVKPGLGVSAADLPREVFGEIEGQLSAVELIARLGDLRNYIAGDPAKITPPLERAMGMLEFYSSTARALDLFPPRAKEEEKWMSAGEIMLLTVDEPEAREWGFARLNAVSGLVTAVDDPAAFHQRAEDLSALVTADAKDRGEYGKVGMEVLFYKGKFFYRALELFLLGFILIALSWLAPASRWASRAGVAVVALTVLAQISLITGIVMRCVIQSRPPVHNLYDTILFITAVAVAVALFIEWVDRQRIGVAVASVLGSAGMFLAMRFEVKNAGDTIESVRAVLNSNFWLSTHVTSITIGYAAGLLASGIAHGYLLGRLFGAKKGDRDFYRGMTRKTYGVICFALFFSLVGTVLGGVWANYSWGRFWGWDPKENGALMIVLWNLIILHARMGGYVRELGVNVLAIIGGMIVSFSWWGVNQLGVGLHSYGFTHGVWPALFSFWAFELLVLAGAAFLWAKERAAGKDRKRSSGIKGSPATA